MGSEISGRSLQLEVLSSELLALVLWDRDEGEVTGAGLKSFSPAKLESHTLVVPFYKLCEALTWIVEGTNCGTYGAVPVALGYYCSLALAALSIRAALSSEKKLTSQEQHID